MTPCTVNGSAGMSSTVSDRSPNLATSSAARIWVTDADDHVVLDKHLT